MSVAEYDCDRASRLPNGCSMLTAGLFYAVMYVRQPRCCLTECCALVTAANRLTMKVKWHVRSSALFPLFTGLESSNVCDLLTSNCPSVLPLLSPHLCLNSSGWVKKVAPPSTRMGFHSLLTLETKPPASECESLIRSIFTLIAAG